MVSSKFKIFIIALEPTPYTLDLWNASIAFKNISATVVFLERKDWLPDSGHNFEELPDFAFKSKFFVGKNLLSKLNIIKYIFLNTLINRHDVYFVNGYHKFQNLITILLLIINRRKFYFCVDKLNNGKVESNFQIFAYIYRYILRFLVFKFSIAIMSCGQPGINSILKAGCREDKVYNFPYVIDKNRMMDDLPENLPSICLQDLKEKKIILTFSGRMILRKGLKNLIKSISMLEEEIYTKFIFWIEGDGPLLNEFKRYAAINLKKVNYKFLGFCQYKLHSWLIRNSTIIVVPSLQDNWGIVVDEAQQLGKVIIASNKVSSALDRIKDGENGFIYNASDCIELKKILTAILNNKSKITDLGKAALLNKRTIKPLDNIELIDKIYKNN